jgi:hypothetical protein
MSYIMILLSTKIVNNDMCYTHAWMQVGVNLFFTD